MSKFNRRSLIKGLAASGIAFPVMSALQGCSAQPSKNTKPHVVVIGGGFGGATVAKYIKRFDRNIDVTLIEPKTEYMTCPGSNWYLAGLIDVKSLTHNYEALKTKHNVKVIHQIATDINAAAKSVTLDNGEVLNYDRLVVSPGIDFIYDQIEGYSEEVAEIFPHAWQAGPQTHLLAKQIQEMPQGGKFLMVAPPNPYRCAPGPYERISMVAAYFKEHNPTATIMILDPKKKFSKQALFYQGWQDLYGQMIEWYGAQDGATVTKIDVESKTAYSDFDEITADVINIIPAQKAGKIAFKAGLTNETGWCPVDQDTFESTIQKDVYVVGDSSIAGAMPKSGHSASSQGKMCAAAVVSSLNNLPMPETRNVNTCYSLISKDWGISIVGVYENRENRISGIKGAGGVSPMGMTQQERKMEADYARGWYKSITMDVWGS
ncbi:FAD-dependent oxidoreductase [Thiomicrorhabdus sp. 6S2-11]|jgi:sulfide dehydrogenase [flavocytochrome c] flavoprotein subunit|uniref:FAD-dependent oxidoreductase n=1 Tax=Thiomicrorhabdus marina TaxID=2818442 RepID=A0ABS3Q4W3_9GAMM|nr:NAD(P)/FAD-dependent oxidoreductase [Thiomicrorhabdus marina]MBO1926994.1 FAD-dependent oxidoreductase [Thiomicrorhabdus marina]